MAGETQEKPGSGQPAPLRVSRWFDAPPATVFRAWSAAEHVTQWFSPKTYSNPDAVVEMRPGGRFEVLMRAPDGTEHWTRGTVREMRPAERLVLDLHATDAGGKRLFGALTEVDFVPERGGTRLEVLQSYTFDDPAIAAEMVKGAPEGWSQTLDKLEAEVARLSRRA